MSAPVHFDLDAARAGIEAEWEKTAAIARAHPKADQQLIDWQCKLMESLHVFALCHMEAQNVMQERTYVRAAGLTLGKTLSMLFDNLDDELAGELAEAMNRAGETGENVVRGEFAAHAVQGGHA